MSEENKAIVRKVYDVIATADLDRAEEIVDPDAPDDERPSGAGEQDAKLLGTFGPFAAEIRIVFPDTRATVEDMIAEGDRIAARATMHGTHWGEFRGIAPAGKRVEVRALDIFRMADGKIVEHRDHGDDSTVILWLPQRS